MHALGWPFCQSMHALQTHSTESEKVEIASVQNRTAVCAIVAPAKPLPSRSVLSEKSAPRKNAPRSRLHLYIYPAWQLPAGQPHNGHVHANGLEKCPGFSTRLRIRPFYIGRRRCDCMLFCGLGVQVASLTLACLGIEGWGRGWGLARGGVWQIELHGRLRWNVADAARCLTLLPPP